jgi:hypothetical protein
MQVSRTPTPLNRLATYNPNRAVGRRQGTLAGLGDTGPVNLTGTPDQIAAMIAANMNVPVLSTPAMPDLVTLGNAIATINSNVPQVPVQENVPAPSVNGSVHSALSGTRSPLDYLGSHGLGGLGASSIAIAQSGAAIGASVIAIDVGIGAFAGPIGAAVGLVVGIIASLFHHKTVSPPTTQAQITASQNFIAQYKQIAGTCIGRAYATSTIQDIAMAFCINADVQWNNAGGCGNQAGITNTWNEQLVRLNAFFTAMQSVAVGQTITMRDIPSLPGHGGTNLNVTYEFPNPGVNAPNYILGPYYAQYFYTMCNIFQDEANCAGLQLTAPVPQFYCDLIDWYRAQYPKWDIPAGTIDAPVEYTNLTLAPGQVNTTAATPTVPALTLAATGINPNVIGASLTINSNGTAAETGGSVSTALTNSNPILQAGGAAPASSMTATGQSVAASLGMSSDDLWLIGGAAVLLLVLYRMRST